MEGDAKAMRKVLLAFFVLTAACGVSRDDTGGLNGQTSKSELANGSPADRPGEKVSEPIEVKRCLAKPHEVLDVLADQDPRQYLKGDFDGDGVLDWALAVKGHQTRRNGVLICTGRDRMFLLGTHDSKNAPFSDMPNDNFVAPQWKVYTKEEAAKVQTIDKEPSTQVASPKGDSIAMIWEDGICLIYWDGNRYRWGCGQ
jgi:hypothetical protein